LDKPENEPYDFYYQYVKIVLDVFRMLILDLGQLRYITLKLFGKYMQPIVDGKIKREETMKLYSNILPVLKKMGNDLYLRNVPSSMEFEKNALFKSN
jgi:hypothetical protein